MQNIGDPRPNLDGLKALRQSMMKNFVGAGKKGVFDSGRKPTDKG